MQLVLSVTVPLTNRSQRQKPPGPGFVPEKGAKGWGMAGRIPRISGPRRHSQCLKKWRDWLGSMDGTSQWYHEITDLEISSSSAGKIAPDFAKPYAILRRR